jgi:thioesterase domain-containing protein
VTVRCERADVADRAALARVVAAVAPPLGGLVHAAGVLDDGVLGQQTWSRFLRVLAPKLLGALHLRALTRHLPLDFSWFFSSSAGLLGAAGQGNYAAANAALDALAELERGEGRPTTSIAWGAWAGTGMAARRASSTGNGSGSDGGAFAALDPDDGRAALVALLSRRAPAVVAVTRARWRRLARTIPGGRVPRWLSSLCGAADAAPAARSSLAAELAALEPTARAGRIATLLRAELRAALGLGEHEPIAGDADLASFGVDSLVAIQVPQLLSERFGLPLPSTLVNEARTLDALTATLSARLGGERAAAATAPGLLVLRRAPARLPLLCVGGAPGDALYLGELSRHLPADQPFYGLQAPGLDGRAAPLATIEEIAAHHLAEAAGAGVGEPYLLAGHSFGGFVAYEMARQLRARGATVALVALLDSVGVGWNDAALPFDEDWVAGELARVLLYTNGARQGVQPDELAALPPKERVRRLVGSGEDTALARQLVDRLVAVKKANLEAMVRYRPRRLDVDLHLFRARDRLDSVLAGQFDYPDARDLGWGAHTDGRVHIHEVPGNHFTMVAAPHVQALAAALGALLPVTGEPVRP